MVIINIGCSSRGLVIKLQACQGGWCWVRLVYVSSQCWEVTCQVTRRLLYEAAGRPLCHGFLKAKTSYKFEFYPNKINTTPAKYYRIYTMESHKRIHISSSWPRCGTVSSLEKNDHIIMRSGYVRKLNLHHFSVCKDDMNPSTFSQYIPLFNTLRPRQDLRHFADDTFKRIFVNENVRILMGISLKFVPKGPINNIPALVQIMARRRLGDKPLSEPMIACLPTHICVARPQWVNGMQCHCKMTSHEHRGVSNHW